jgi:putative methionine-R-sulfoxide reductase with GAF domain
MIVDRRSCLRHKVHGPAFASFDGVTGGVILDLSEQGLSMQTTVPLQANRRIDLSLDLPGSTTRLETTGYIAWADALGRAGVRFSELPEDARHRIDEWLTLNDAAPSRTAPKLNVGRSPWLAGDNKFSGKETLSISLEPEAVPETEAGAPEMNAATSNTVQYEFNSLGSDLNAALRIISERARSLIRANGAAIALVDRGPMMCRASVGTGGPPLGTRVDVDSGLTGECVRTGKALRCDDAENDTRVDAETCRRLGIRSILAAPIRYERDTVGLMEVFSPQSFAFDEGDLAVLERLAQTVVLTVSQTAVFKRV